MWQVGSEIAPQTLKWFQWFHYILWLFFSSKVLMWTWKSLSKYFLVFGSRASQEIENHKIESTFLILLSLTEIRLINFFPSQKNQYFLSQIFLFVKNSSQSECHQGSMFRVCENENFSLRSLVKFSVIDSFHFTFAFEPENRMIVFASQIFGTSKCQGKWITLFQYCCCLYFLLLLLPPLHFPITRKFSKPSYWFSLD